MKNSLDQIYLGIHNKFLRTKRLRHYVNSPRFQRAYKLADLDIILSLIDKEDLNGLKKYVDKLLEDNLTDQKIGVLREIARGYLVPNYYLLTRMQLIEEIENVKNQSNRHQQEIDRLQSESQN
jgi:hypothetical protein